MKLCFRLFFFLFGMRYADILYKTRTHTYIERTNDDEKNEKDILTFAKDSHYMRVYNLSNWAPVLFTFWWTNAGIESPPPFR